MTAQPLAKAHSSTDERPVSGGFVAGTPVHTDKGLLPIERIQLGDRVLSRCEHSGEQSYQRVSRTFSTEEQEICAIAAEGALNPDGSDFLVEYLFATPEHPIWVNNHGWLPVKALCGCGHNYDIRHWSFARADGRQAEFYPYLDTVGYPLHEANQDYFLDELAAEGDPSLAGSKGYFLRMDGGDDCPGFILIFNGNRFDDNYGPSVRGPFHTIPQRRSVYHGARRVGGYVDGMSHEIDPLRTSVHGIELENFHTCFIGDLGVLVRTA